MLLVRLPITIRLTLAVNNPALDQLLQHPAIWRAGQLQGSGRACVPSGFQALDAELPGSGWPIGALTELLVDDQGIGEISLLSPALRYMSKEGKGTALISPVCLPFARAWEAHGIRLDRLLIIETAGNDLLWSAEQVLKSGSCGLVLIWGQHAPLDYSKLRRLQRSAEVGNTACMLYRAQRAQAAPSAAPLRITLAARTGGLMARIIKRRGGIAAHPILLSIYPSHWHAPQSTTLANDASPVPSIPVPIQSTPSAIRRHAVSQ
jgi:hypothetical protein